MSNLQLNPIDEIELDIINMRNWFAQDKALLDGYIVALLNQGIITNETSVWLGQQILQLETHFKGLEIQCYKLKDLTKKERKNATDTIK